MIKTYLELELFVIGELVISLKHILGLVLILFISYFLYKKIIKNYVPKYFKLLGITKTESGYLNKLIRYVFVLVAIEILVNLFELNYHLFSFHSLIVNVNLIVKIILIYQFSKLLVWGIDNIIHNFYVNRQTGTKEEKDHDVLKESAILSVMRYIIYLSASITILSLSGLSSPDFQYRTIIGEDIFSLGISKILTAILIILIARLIVWILTQYVFFNLYNRKQIPFAQRFAINQLILYVIYVIAIFIALHYLFGDKMTIIWGGAAALLVGIGLGLQQTFNDFFSGLVLLFERSVGVGDIIEVEQRIGKVLKIGMRSSLVETRDLTTIVVPNSKMVNLNVQNLSHEFPSTRFDVLVSVAYGTDTKLVEQLLLESLEGVSKVLKSPIPRVQFKNFGDDGLEFRLLFYTKELFRVERIKSDIRFNIDTIFRKHDITIPFPQRQIWMSNEK